MFHKKPRGHSNVYANETTQWPHPAEDKACVPLVGGARLETCRPLPPLALSREEWEEIGIRMGWRVRRPAKSNAIAKAE